MVEDTVQMFAASCFPPGSGLNASQSRQWMRGNQADDCRGAPATLVMPAGRY